MIFRNKKGTALVEFLIVLPFLILLVFTVIDLGAILYNYFVYSDSVNVGMRVASDLSNLKVGYFENQTQGQDCSMLSTAASEDYNEEHRKIQNAITEMLNNNFLINKNDICIQTKLEPDSDPTKGLITIELDSLYDGISPFLQNFPLKVTSKGHYLFDLS
ncbi:MAG: pilus assembly protein [Proteobacteria bacterium]|nr:pilus assembly protein [Pseudomonadota bacterium]